ncbi:hypothetical protein [Streptomyces sp. NPDC000410]|uniref:hypothetical protein n=1 Tax=Streptomyces sp. NPDC000410 TaxID=3154254 RepID=UPI0033308427
MTLVAAGLFTWWNTDVLGRKEFCNQAFTSSEMNAVLGGSGRLTQKSVYEEDDTYGFSCTVQRTNRFIGNSQPQIKVEDTIDTADFALGSLVWKKPSGSSYFTGKITGAASESEAWVLLPSDCRDGMPSTVRKDLVPSVEVHLTQGRATPEALAQVAMSTARHMAKGLDCADAEGLDAPVRLQGPVNEGKPVRTDRDNACGLKGFRLPEVAFIAGKAKPGTERFTGGDTQTWVCDLMLRGPGEPQITFSISEAPDLTDGARRGMERASPNSGRTVVKCVNGDLYASMYLWDSYAYPMLDQEEQDAGAYEKAHEALFDAFLKTAVKERGCNNRP